jgi:hypothetical protein
MQIATSCGNVEGATHTSNSDKGFTSVIVFVEDGATLQVDITVVMTAYPSEYYYSSYIIKGAAPAPTRRPTPPPTVPVDLRLHRHRDQDQRIHRSNS